MSIEISYSLLCKAADSFFPIFGEEAFVDTLCMIWLEVVIGDPAKDNVVEVRHIDDLPVL